MSVSAIGSGNTAPVGPEGQEAERVALVLKRTQDVAKDTANAVVDLIAQAAPKGDVGRKISVYA
jgi:hypothetical protein